ncbi:MAG: DeoR/GlpR transcriptional regulator [Treponema sp.]|nr:DeoR/GlpR transcriptional regulator [Treponema sp.]
MFAKERHMKILSLVAEKRSMTVQQLTDELSASESTVRRDLATLDSQGMLVKVYGGAIAKGMVFTSTDDTVRQRKGHHHEAKSRIARYAAALIEPKDFVYLDAGTTTEMMIDFITCKNAVFVTNGFSHARRLSERGFLTYILGGEIKIPTEAVVGEEAMASLAKYHFTKGFWGCNGISPNSGFSTPDIKEALVKQVSMAHTQQKFVLSDASKFSQISCVTFAAFSDATVITAGLESGAYRKFPNIVDVAS